VALVTGASRGIGLAVAHRMARDGAKVCITARGAEGLQAAVSEFAPDDIVAVSGKADDPAHREEVLDVIGRTWGRLDILVNNAGINPFYGSMLDLPLETARKILEVNVVSSIAWVQAVVGRSALGFSEAGAVVNIGSVTARTPSPGIGMYGVSKAAVAQLTRTLAVELGPAVRVNAVEPAVVKTSFSRALYEHDEAGTAAQYPLLRLGTPDDVAAAVAFLASDDAAWITGEVLTVDGGLMVAGGHA
jgi:NAD(P)-dependent dehydrogenase (short-subunit alcohol dehydrogenase family)